MVILLTSVGRRSYLVNYFKEALGSDGEVHVANSSDISPAFKIADKSVVSPYIYDDNYIPFLINYCKSNNVKAIISLFDIDLPILSINKIKFEEIGTTVIVSDVSTIAICNDKWKSYHFFKNNGINTPKTFISLCKALEAVKEKEIIFPLMVKPRWGMGSIAIYEAENEEELYVFYNKVKRNILNTYLKYESIDNIENSVIIQEKINGQEYGLDVINDLDRNYQTAIVKMKYAMRSGETDCAVTVQNSQLEEIGYQLSKTMRHIANLDVDAFILDNEVYVLEMNARFGGGYPFSHIAGVNLPKAIIHWLNEENFDKCILTPHINIVAQKNIEIVRIFPNLDIRIDAVDNIKEAEALLLNFEKWISPTLIDRGINITQFSNKLFQNGIILKAIDELQNNVGILCAYINDVDSKIAYISFLSINPKYRRMNLGTKLIQKAEKIAFNNGMSCIKLEVKKDNYNAISFYKKHYYSIISDASVDYYYMSKGIKENNHDK